MQENNLIKAIIQNELTVVRNYAGDVNFRSIGGNTPLMIAVSWQRKDIVRALIDNGAQIYAKNNHNRTVFDIIKQQQTTPVWHGILAIPEQYQYPNY
ncbi:MAG: ankyrin repeat domain-containing protein [Proteobacteria bacterium]|nr:ankyrin repeat domain-containing protein [Pseudomonadota bacterium]